MHGHLYMYAWSLTCYPKFVIKPPRSLGCSLWDITQTSFCFIHVCFQIYHRAILMFKHINNTNILRNQRLIWVCMMYPSSFIQFRFEKNNISIIWQRDHRSIMFEKNTDMNVYMEFEGKKYQNRTWNKISKLCTLVPFWPFISWKRHEPKNYTSKLNRKLCKEYKTENTLFQIIIDVLETKGCTVFLTSRRKKREYEL